MNAPFFLWAIYDRPSDFPRGPRFVARKQSVAVNGEITVDPAALSCDSLSKLREAVQRQGADMCIRRSRGDDPHIVECWL